MKPLWMAYDRPRGRPSRGVHVAVRRTLVATGAVAMAFMAREAVRPLLGNASPFLLFTPAVAAAAYYGGTTAGAAATIVSAFLGSHFFLAGAGELPVDRWDRVALFFLVGALITGLDAISRSAHHRLNDSLRSERDARAQAEEANRAKDRFLAVVSHELQTPMSVVLGWAQALRRRNLDPQTLERALDAIERNAALQHRLVADLVDVSRIATGRLRLDPGELSLHAVLRSAVDQVADVFATRDIESSVTLPEDDCRLVGDAIRLQQVFANLLGNAAKFTSPQGRVTVQLTCTASDAVVVITDSGIGIHRDFLPFVFDPFRQDARAVSTAGRGLGLGLAIARHCVEGHDGTIHAESDGPGLGARFIVRLPRLSRSMLTRVETRAVPRGVSDTL